MSRNNVTCEGGEGGPGCPGGPGCQCGPGGQGGPGVQGAVHPMRRQIFANTVGRICKLNLTLRRTFLSC